MCVGVDLLASSMIPEIPFGGMTVLAGCFFLFCGFIAGDCLTARAGFFVDDEDVFLFDLRRAAAVGPVGGAEKSRLGSMGEVVSEVSEPRTAP